MDFEKVDVLDEKTDHIILVLDAVEGRNPQKFIELLPWSW